MFNSNEVLTALEQALNTSQFYMVYQPIFNLHTQQISGFEALMRWNSPQMGMISPDILLRYWKTVAISFQLKTWLPTPHGMWRRLARSSCIINQYFRT